MNTRIKRITTGFLLAGLLMNVSLARAQQPISLGKLPDGQEVRTVQNPDKSYGLQIGSSVSGVFPVQFIVSGNDPNVLESAMRLGYTSIARRQDTLVGTTDCRHPFINDRQVVARVTDRWLLQANELRLWRRVEVLANAPQGFATGTFLTQRVGEVINSPRASFYIRNLYEQFVPGMIYGTTDNLPPKAIGTVASYRNGALLIREDRLPMPMTAVRMTDGLSIAVLNPQPTGETTLRDSENFVKNGPDTSSRIAPRPVTDQRIRTGAFDVSLLLGMLTYRGDSTENRLQMGYRYPASEVPVTYQGNTYPDVGEQKPRTLFHPLSKGFTQTYSLIFRFSKTDNFPQLVRENWRWAWQKLQPAVNHHDISAARRSLIAQLSSQVEERPTLTGIPNWRPAVTTDSSPRDPMCVMGFTGKALESAEMLLWAADHLRGQVPDDTLLAYRRKGEGLFRSFVDKIKLNPPNGEGFNMDTGTLGDAYPNDGIGYLRSYGDDLKATIRAYRREKAAGRRHNDWLAWAQRFGDWLLTQQRPNGSFPRAWKTGSGQVHDASATSTYNAIPLLALLAEEAESAGYPYERYREAALRAGEYAWSQSGQRFGRFTGGTIDNPDVLDKEAGTLSLEAYLLLYEADEDGKWLDRAKAAADFAETWIYGWNVPMPIDADDRNLHWKKGVSTVGLQLIATGHSLADAYMAFDADEYAKLYRITGDEHYRDVARLLLHNTLAMTALPGRTYDLRGPGWQQEHWSLAPWRGHGFHRGWLPWVSCSHLNGMTGLEEFDKNLFDELCK